MFICPSSKQKRANNAITEGGFWGMLSYAQNGMINNGQDKMGSAAIKDPSGTILYADTDGWDACLYPDGSPEIANVCYRHSGGTERSTEKVRVSGSRTPKRRANAAYFDTHVQSISRAPRQAFTPELD